MTLIIPDGNDGADSILETVKEHLKEVALDIDACRNRLKHDPMLDAGDLKKLMADYRTITNNCVMEANRLEEQRKRRTGVVHDFALDFEAARSEIRQRMACLRRAGHAGEISE